MIAIFALINAEVRGEMVIVLGDAGGGFGFFFSVIADFVGVADPAALGFVDLVFVF